MLVEARGDLGRLDGDAGVEIVEVVAHRARNVLRALAEPFDHFAAVGLHRAVELGEMAGDEVAERGGVARDPFGELGAAMIEHVLERCEPASPASRCHRSRRRLRRCTSASVLARGRGNCSRVDLWLPRCTMVSVMRAPVCSSLETTSPPRRLRSRTSESPVFLSVVLTSSTRLEIVSARAGLPVLDHERRSVPASGWLIMSRIAADFSAKALGHSVEPRRHHVLQGWR